MLLIKVIWLYDVAYDTFHSIYCFTNKDIFTREYPFTLSGKGYGKILYPHKDMDTGDGKNWGDE